LPDRSRPIPAGVRSTTISLQVKLLINEDHRLGGDRASRCEFREYIRDTIFASGEGV
jgi:hypothetical protein